MDVAPVATLITDTALATFVREAAFNNAESDKHLTRPIDADMMVTKVAELLIIA